MLREIELALIKIHILYHANAEAVFGIGLIRELSRHGYTISPGTLYPILSKMENARLMVSEKRTVNHKQRKYYRITDSGKTLLKDMESKVHELHAELFS